jgi:hypothetical protein
MILLVINDNVVSEHTSKKQDKLPLVSDTTNVLPNFSAVSICNLFNGSGSNK